MNRSRILPYTLQKLTIIAVIGLICFFRFYGANHPYLSQWDEAYHALVAKNFLTNPLEPKLFLIQMAEYDPFDWNNAYIWLHKPPLSFWFSAFSFFLFGVSEFTFRLPGVLLSLASLALTFFIARALRYPPKIAFLSSAIHGFLPLPIFLVTGVSCCGQVDSNLIFFSQLSILLFLKASQYSQNDMKIFWCLGGIATGLAILTKSISGLIPMAIFFCAYFFIGKRKIKIIKHCLIVASTATIFSSFWFVYSYLRWPNIFKHELLSQILHVSSAIENHSHPFYYYVKNFPHDYGIIVSVFLCITLFHYCTSYKTLPARDKFLAFYFLLPLLLFSVSKTKMPGFLAITAPSVSIQVALGIRRAIAFCRCFLFFKRQVKAGILISLFCICIIGTETFFRFKKKDINRVNTYGWIANRFYQYDDFREKISALKGGKKKIILNVQDVKHIQAMFYSGYQAIPYIPEAEKLKKFLENNYEIVIINPSGQVKGIEEESYTRLSVETLGLRPIF